jgi:ribosomal protein S18 acetylase RimI-like enzyme
VHDALEAHLEARGYRRADETRVMCRPLEPPSARGAHAITLLPQTEWLDAYGEITATPDTARSLHGLLLNAIRTPHALAVLRRTTRGHEASPDALACGLGVLESELLGLFDLATHTQHRRRGYGRALLEGLLHWGARAGARHAYLQVLEANSIARRLYEQMNFATLYRYWYRIAPD